MFPELSLKLAIDGEDAPRTTPVGGVKAPQVPHPESVPKMIRKLQRTVCAKVVPQIDQSRFVGLTY